jgi:type I restriction enzyme, S subunit
VSELPKGWALTALGQLVTVNYGRALPEQLRNPLGSAPVVGSSGVVGKHDAALVEHEAIVVGRKGAAGAVHLMEQPFWPIDTAYYILPPKGLHARWVAHYLGSRQLGRLDKSTAIPSLSRDDLYREQVPVAPSNEQLRIVAKLEELLSDLDAGVAELKAAQKKLAQYRQSLLKAAVEGRLTEAWRAQHPPTETGAQLLERILTERRARWEAKQLAKFQAQGKTPPKDWQKKYPEPVRPDTTGLPELPEGWVWASIGECFHVVVGATPSRKEPSYWNGGISWVSSGEVRFNRISTTKETITEAGLRNSSTQINPVGTVLLGMIGEGKTRGQVAILDIEAANNQNCAAIWVAEAPVPPEFVYYWLWSRYNQTRRGSSGNNQPALNKSIVERILMPLPPLAEAQELVRLVGATLEEIGQQELAISLALQQSTAQRQNILRAAFSGQLVPQDPNDEPASVLLERIRAERAAQQAGKKSRGRKAREMV